MRNALCDALGMDALDTPAKRLRWARERDKRYSTPTEAARAFGWTVPTYLGHENGDRNPSRDAAKRYAEAYKVPWAWILEGGPPPDRNSGFSEPAAPAPLPRAKMEPASLFGGPLDVPVWASAAAGDDGAIVLVPDPIDYVRRSERMLSVRNPFAFNVIGSSMSPAIEHGNLVVINPSVVATPGDDCVFIHEGPDGMLALVKRYLRPGSEQWRVRQFNPAKDFEISRKKWSRVHPISEIRRR